MHIFLINKQLYLYMGLKVDLAGKRFGKLIVISEAGRDKNGKCLWLCMCDCGKEKVALSQPIQDGRTTSCGCVHLKQLTERSTKHGLAKVDELHELYSVWTGIKQRCLNEKNKAYYRYGARGITICDRWLNNFENFLNDMGERPSKKHSIERIDNNKNYEPSNCTWATIKEQSRNKNNNIWIEYDDKRMIVADWAEHIGISQQHLMILLRTHVLSDIIIKYKNEDK